MPFVTAIDSPIKNRSSVPLQSQKSNDFFKAVDVVTRHCNGVGFVIKMINADRQFKPLLEQVDDDMHIKMNCTAADDHVPEAERNNRVVGERMRAACHKLPCDKLPKVMIRHMAMVCTEQLTLFFVKGGVSPRFAPNAVLGGEPCNCKKHLQVPFGACGAEGTKGECLWRPALPSIHWPEATSEL